MSSIALPDLDALQGTSRRELEHALREVDMVVRRAEALRAEIIGVAERSGVFAEDGHGSVSGWAKATCNWSNATARGVVQTAHLLHACTEARAAAKTALLGVDQLRVLARVHANPRCRDWFSDSASLLVGHAQGLCFDEFHVVARRWEALADADGAHRAHDHAQRHRDAHVGIVGDEAVLDAHGGVVAGVAMREVFDRFCEAEFHADWETGVAEHGQAMHPDLLQRTARQRRFDALAAIFAAAATSGVAGKIEPLVNLIVDLDTFEHHVARLCGAETEPIDPNTVDVRRCETDTGHQVDPTDVLAAAMIGHVRRVVLDSTGVVVDLGRKRRLFTGTARQAVLLGERWCIWPGCDLRSGRCQTDHSQPWIADGETRPGNGAPLCARHNRWKQHGYRTWRDPQGQWHTQRPDGTELGHHADPNAPPHPLAGN